jgi:hypothetical protein
VSDVSVVSETAEVSDIFEMSEEFEESPNAVPKKTIVKDTKIKYTNMHKFIHRYITICPEISTATMKYASEKASKEQNYTWYVEAKKQGRQDLMNVIKEYL